jgi:iron complex transport system permease protein
VSGTVLPQTSVRETNSRRFSASTVLMSLGLLLALTAFASLAVGPTGVSIGSLPRAIAAAFGHVVDANAAREQLVLIDIRLPRTLLAMFVGASLAMAGAMMQGMFRNPLAEPNVVGVSAGAALGAVVSFVTGLAAASALWLPLCAFVGALGALAVVYSITARAGRTPVATLMLAGIALSALLSSVTTLLVSVSFVDWQVSAEIVFLVMGVLDSRTLTHVWICLPFVTLGTFVALWYTRDLDLMMLGEEK